MGFLNTIKNSRFWKRNAAQLMWAIALLCLAIILSKITWTIYSQSQIKQANYQPQEVSPIVQTAGVSYRVNDILSANLFGDPTPKVVVENAPKTTLDLSLQGVLWASDPKLARAIITAGKKKSELYSIGEEIKGAGASIKEIRANEVLLDRNGATESLPMVKITSGTNEQLVVFSDPNANLNAEQQLQQQQLANSLDASGSANRRPRSQLSNPRSSTPNSQLNQNSEDQLKKSTKPDLSSLDKALQKMGEM